MMNKIKKIEYFIKNELNEINWVHTQSVRSIAQKIAKNEGGNKLIIDMAILFHDIAKDKKPLLTHAESSAIIAKKYLKKLKFNEKIIKRIVHCIESHSTPWSKNGPTPASIEAKIVFDADMIQQLSPFGIVKHILKYKDKKYSDLVFSARHDLFGCYHTLITKTGKRMAKQRIKYVKNFFNSIEKY